MPVEPNALTVYYDGACPLCRREVDFYRRRARAESITWVDAAAAESELIADDLKRSDALSRFHVRLPNGTLESGAEGFAALWCAVPGFGWLGRLCRSRPMRPVMELTYRLFLKVRPLMQRSAAVSQIVEATKYPRWLQRELRSDHAGETGAVAIYAGILAVSRCPEVRSFAARHQMTEIQHLHDLQELLAVIHRSKLLALWWLLGFITGAVPALFGPRAVYATIDAVETFVDLHYRAQIERLTNVGRHCHVREVLQDCRHDELSHRDEARQLGCGKRSVVLRLWLGAVRAGSSLGVAIARRF
tara:strand:- start:220 stop:1125 length:906 start_codon:yes stop_codon:yes gene_type:complete